LHSLTAVMTLRAVDKRGKPALFRVQRRGNSSSGTPVRLSDPILTADTSELKRYYAEQIEMKEQEKRALEGNVRDLTQFVRNGKRTLRENQTKFKNHLKLMKSLQREVQSVSERQSALEEDHEGEDELQQRLTELRGSIEDENATIRDLETEIAPFKEKEDELLKALSIAKKEKMKIEAELKASQRSSDLLRRKFEKMTDKLRSAKQKIEKIPRLIHKAEMRLKEVNAQKEEKEQEIAAARGDAESAGAEVTPANYPHNPENHSRVFTPKQLRDARKRLEAQIAEWRSANGDDGE